MNLKNIFLARCRKGLKQKDVAEYLGITKGTYSKKENGQIKFSLVEAYKLSKLFGTSVENLFFDKDSDEKTSA